MVYLALELETNTSYLNELADLEQQDLKIVYTKEHLARGTEAVFIRNMNYTYKNTDGPSLLERSDVRNGRNVITYRENRELPVTRDVDFPHARIFPIVSSNVCKQCDKVRHLVRRFVTLDKIRTFLKYRRI